VRISRIYQPVKLKFGILIQLDKSASNHTVNVLRLKINAPLIIFNGEGGEYAAEITQIKRHAVKVKIGRFQNINRESKLKIHLIQSISRSEKIDFILQKAVELGVTKITPIITERCKIKLSKDRQHKRIARWQKIIISACEQCGRNILPELNQITHLADLITTLSADLKIILNPEANNTLHNVTGKPKSIAILIGSEGGFTENEIQLTEKYNFCSIKLGPRILRTETAGLAIISILQKRFGDF